MGAHAIPGEKRRRAVVLLSGGLDSATALAIANARDFSCHALSFRYGQRHEIEVDAARRIAESMNVAAHIIMPIDLRAFGGSALTDRAIDVPRDRGDAIDTADNIPATYVPARNTVFLSIAVACAEAIHARDIFIGVNAIDYSGYPDCRPQFIEAFQRAANLGTRAGVEGEPFTVHAPLIEMRKHEIIRTGIELGVDYSLTRSCYDPDARGRACGRCDSCILRRRGFEEAGVPDPTEYSSVTAPSC